jgi:hypothetical protein
VAQPQHNEALARRRGSTLGRAFAVTSAERAIDTVLARRQAREQQDR